MCVHTKSQSVDLKSEFFNIGLMEEGGNISPNPYIPIGSLN